MLSCSRAPRLHRASVLWRSILQTSFKSWAGVGRVFFFIDIPVFFFAPTKKFTGRFHTHTQHTRTHAHAGARLVIRTTRLRRFGTCTSYATSNTRVLSAECVPACTNTSPHAGSHARSAGESLVELSQLSAPPPPTIGWRGSAAASPVGIPASSVLEPSSLCIPPIYPS